MEQFSEIGFDQPSLLWLLLLLPGIWVLSFRSLAGLGAGRRWAAILIRSLLFTVLVLALAEIHWRNRTDRLTVLYLLDQSDSIPREQREAMLTYVARSVEQHRREGAGEGTGDLAGVLVFGANAQIEAAPAESSLPIVGRVEANAGLEGDRTNLEAALRLAKAAFPEDTARRVVVVTDGNENAGDVLRFAQAFARDGIGIDVVPIRLERQADVSVDKLMVPSDVRKDQSFEARVVLTNENPATAENPEGMVAGELILKQSINGRDELIAKQTVELNPGKNVINFQHKLEQSDIVTLDAIFQPAQAEQDTIVRNNAASAFAHVRGKGRVLLIEDSESPGEFLQLVERLRAAAIEVDIMESDSLFTSAAELLQYDSVILANVARTSEKENGVVGFSDQQIQMLVDNCRELGCGIVMIGGERSLGAGGWSNTELEKAMPVDFQIKNDKISAVGALAMVMHASEMAEGNFWQVKVGQEALNVLGPMDYCGVVDWSDMSGEPRWLWRMPNGIDQVSTQRKRMLAMLARMAPGDMPDFGPPMELALMGLKATPASMKHMIIISDGDPAPPGNALIKRFNDAKIQISTVAIGTHGPANSKLLQDIAKATGGKYYTVSDPRALPKIYQREARRVAKPVIKESKNGMRALSTSLTARHEMLQGVDSDNLPPFFGYVMTTIKKSPLVEQLLVASDPPDQSENATLLATWRYELGRTVVFTSDAGNHWTTNWYNHEYYDKLFSQMVRFSMRPVTQNANFSIGTDLRDGQCRIVVTAMDAQDNFINFLNVNGRGIAPGGGSEASSGGFDLNFSQTGPGRYEAVFDAARSGNYLLNILPGEGYERLTTGVNVPYSSEYSDRKTNDALLSNLASLKPESGDSGQKSADLVSRDELTEPLKLNPFRPTMRHTAAIEAMWPTMLVWGAWIFLSDVFVRRVAVGFDWLGNILRYIQVRFGGKATVASSSHVDRLRSRKSEITRQLDARRSEMRFEPVAEDKAESGRAQLQKVLENEREREQEPPVPRPVKDLLTEEDVLHTSRLLDAKRRARKNPPAE